MNIFGSHCAEGKLNHVRRKSTSAITGNIFPPHCTIYVFKNVEYPMNMIQPTNLCRGWICLRSGFSPDRSLLRDRRFCDEHAESDPHAHSLGSGHLPKSDAPIDLGRLLGVFHDDAQLKCYRIAFMRDQEASRGSARLNLLLPACTRAIILPC